MILGGMEITQVGCFESVQAALESGKKRPRSGNATHDNADISQLEKFDSVFAAPTLKYAKFADMSQLEKFDSVSAALKAQQRP